MSAPRIAMVAGEASGDALGAALLGALKARWPALDACGIGGPRMAAHGFAAWWPYEKLAVRGYFEVLGHFREILGIRNALVARLRAERPDAFVGVDAPDFNLGVELKLRPAGVKTIHFVSPSIWAWRGKRIHKIGRAADLVLCIFPFEPALYEAHGYRAIYVGHPLASEIPDEPPRAAARAALGLAHDDTVVALLPGSRRSEIQYVAPRVLQAAAELARRRPRLRFVLPVVGGLRAAVEVLHAQHAPGLPLMLLDGKVGDALAACDVAIVASGTATLETALYKRPMVVVYAMHALSWQIGKRAAYLPWVALPNILLREFVVPELLQSEATAAKIADATLRWLDDPAAVAALQARFGAIHRLLRRDTGTIATAAIEAVLAGRDPAPEPGVPSGAR